MLTTDSLIPYILMTMHPLQHMSMLITGLILLCTRYDKFYEIDGVCPEGSEGAEFVDGNKFLFMQYAMVAHSAALVLHWLNQIFSFYEFKVLATFFIVAKMIVYFLLMIQIQEGTDFTECVDVVGKSQVYAWMTIEVLLFYINLGSLSFFIFVNLFKKYRSIRDRVGLAGKQRKTTDFLNYAKDDIHWWSTWFNQFILSVAVLYCRLIANSDANITFSIIELFTKHFFGLYLIRQLYFNSKF